MGFLDWLLGGGWALVSVGVAAVGTALLYGRRVRANRPVSKEAPEVLFESHYVRRETRERRRAPRRTSGDAVEVWLDAGLEAEPIHGWVLDRSIGGLGLVVDEPLAVGAVLRVRAKKTHPTTQGVDITVRFIKPRGEQHELGCQFNRVPSWNVLLQFG